MLVLGVLVGTGCGRLRFEELSSSIVDGATGDGIPACTFGPWSTPRYQAQTSSPGSDYSPALSPDLLQIYFGSDRVVPSEFHIYKATRASTSDDFGPATRVTSLAFPAETDPTISADGKTLYYSAYTGTDLRLARATRTTLDEEFGNPELVPDLGSAQVRGPLLTRAGDELFYSDDNDNRILRATFDGTTFTPRGEVAELNVGIAQGYPALTRDGLQIYYEVVRDDGTFTDMFTARRSAVGAPFETPQKATDLSASGADDDDPDIGSDDLTLVMSSTRETTGADLFLATRACE